MQVYDGDAATGHLLQTFTINESSSSNWPDWPFQNPDTGTDYGFGWSGATTTGNSPLTFYANSGTITVTVDCSALDAEAPTLCLIGDPASRTSVASGGSGSPEISQDFVQYADGGIEPCNCVASAPAGANYSNVNQTLVEGMFGYGRESNLPQLTGDGMLVQAINVPDPGPGFDPGFTPSSGSGSGSGSSCPCNNPPPTTNTPTFTEPGRNYQPMYGTKYTLTESQQAGGQYDLMLTAPDGTVWQFAEPADGQAYATGPWEKTTLADGQTTVVSWINADGQRSSSPMPGDQAMVVDQYASPTATEPEVEDQYTFTTDPVSGAELCSSITYLYWNSTVSNGNGGTGALVYGKQVQYAYYGQGDPNGLPGDLEAITTQYPVGTVEDGATPTWTGNDTYYFRYYIGPTLANGVQIGFAHGLMREILPNSYSSLAAAADSNYPNDTTAEQLAIIDALPDSYVNAPAPDPSDNNVDITNYTCFYFQYDQYDRVTKETVFGKLRTTNFQYIEGTDSQTNTNAWTRETIETRADGSTYTVYTNYLGETLLDDLYDPSDSAHPHTYTYYEYDSCGDVTLQASSSSITGYWNGLSDTAVGTYDGTIVANTDFRIHLGLPADGDGPVEEYAYDYVYVSQFNTPSGLLESRSVADGLSSPSSSGSYYNSTATLQESYTYTARLVQTPMASATRCTRWPAIPFTPTPTAAGPRRPSTPTPGIPGRCKRRRRSQRCRWLPLVKTAPTW